MGYIKNTWVDQDVERPKTYEVTTNQDGSITLTDSFGLVAELGTPVNATNMNHIENGIYDNDAHIGDLTELETSTKTDLVSAINEIISGKADVDLANVNDSGTSRSAGWAMPSNTYIDLTLGASGTTYTAPANGWLVAYNANSDYGSIVLLNTNSYLRITASNKAGFSDGSAFIPCKKNDVVQLTYTGTFGSTNGWLRFVYAVGSESEA